MYATRLMPSVPTGVAGPMGAKRVATPGTTYKTTRFGLYFYLVSCLIAGFVTALCLDHMFGITQTGYCTTSGFRSPTVAFCPEAELDTTLFTDLRKR